MTFPSSLSYICSVVKTIRMLRLHLRVDTMGVLENTILVLYIHNTFKIWANRNHCKKHSLNKQTNEKKKKNLWPTFHSPLSKIFSTHLKKWAFVAVDHLNGSKWDPHNGDQWDNPAHMLSPHWVCVISIASRRVLCDAGGQYTLCSGKDRF